MNKLGDYRWGVTARAAARWADYWQEYKPPVIRGYRCWMAELIHFHKTGSRMLLLLQ
jgi:hypothetical protein